MRNDKLPPRSKSEALKPISLLCASYIYLFASSTFNQSQKIQHQNHPAQRMFNFLGLPPELCDMVYKYLLAKEVQPTACTSSYSLAICNVSKTIQKKAYAVYLSSNNIIIDNSRSACLRLEQISSYRDKQDEKPLHLTFDLDSDNGHLQMRRADRRRFFRLLAQLTKLDLTIIACGELLGDVFRYDDLELMHGFASVSSTPAPAVDSRCYHHRCLHHSCHHYRCRRLLETLVCEAGIWARAMRGLQDHFTSACQDGCEHLADNGM